MSAATNLKQRINWEPSTPRCGTCAFFGHANITLVNSLPRLTPELCLTHTFKTGQNAICDSWMDKKTGVTLDETHGEKASKIHHPDNPNQCRACNRLLGSSRGVFDHYHAKHGNRSAK